MYLLICLSFEDVQFDEPVSQNVARSRMFKRSDSAPHNAKVRAVYLFCIYIHLYS